MGHQIINNQNNPNMIAGGIINNQNNLLNPA
jgi:hypothetical protein